METISTVLQTLMDRKRLTPKELAEGSGVNKNTIYTILKRDTTTVNIHTLKQLADYFGENISIFCGLDGYQPPLRLSNEENHLLGAYRGHPEEIREYVGKLVVDPPKALERQEQRLLSEFRKLSQDGKEKVRDFLDDLIATNKYMA